MSSTQWSVLIGCRGLQATSSAAQWAAVSALTHGGTGQHISLTPADNWHPLQLQAPLMALRPEQKGADSQRWRPLEFYTSLTSSFLRSSDLCACNHLTLNPLDNDTGIDLEHLQDPVYR